MAFGRRCTIFLGVESSVKVGVPNVPGGSVIEVARLGGFRPLVGIALASRVPSLINVADPSGIAFNENLPLASDGTITTDPGPLFEVPIVPPLPEDLVFIP